MTEPQGPEGSGQKRRLAPPLHPDRCDHYETPRLTELGSLTGMTGGGGPRGGPEETTGSIE